MSEFFTPKKMTDLLDAAGISRENNFIERQATKMAEFIIADFKTGMDWVKGRARMQHRLDKLKRRTNAKSYAKITELTMKKIKDYDSGLKSKKAAEGLNDQR
ncbi:MAG: hypothetical protein PHG66_05915 [Candidatus Colwellbacteria bacterium]|nr:hypothetical protein [Candidatus Colwellbacteria bacterium]